MESIGENLREARHNKKLSLEDASRATRIKIEILEQLESDEFDRLAAPTYTKGFLRLYAEYLGLDSQSIVDAYLRSQGGLRRQGLHMETEKTIRASKPRELQLPLRSVGLVVFALTLAVLVVVVGRSVLSHRASRRRGRQRRQGHWACRRLILTLITNPSRNHPWSWLRRRRNNGTWWMVKETHISEGFGQPLTFILSPKERGDWRVVPCH